ncbi:MAG: polyprenyl diphosphate synthase, partial [Patescibacteria group bacterium]
QEVGVENLIVYAFSSENWNRPKEEISFLFSLLREVLTEKLNELAEEGVRLRFIGDRSRFEEDMQKILLQAEQKTAENKKNTLIVALSYGGRDEILRVVKGLLKNGVSPDSVSEESFSKELDTAGMPDPDLIVRTSGEQRLSNFLPWQGAYSEIYFTPTYWPAFSKEEFLKILEWYAGRERRFGK